MDALVKAMLTIHINAIVPCNLPFVIHKWCRNGNLTARRRCNDIASKFVIDEVNENTVNPSKTIFSNVPVMRNSMFWVASITPQMQSSATARLSKRVSNVDIKWRFLNMRIISTKFMTKAKIPTEVYVIPPGK